MILKKAIKAVTNPKKALRILKKRYLTLNIDKTLVSLEKEIKQAKLTIDPGSPKVSIIVVTFNNLKYTKACFLSLLAFSKYPNYEVVIIDNNSTDKTKDYLLEIKKKYPNTKVVLNKNNKGFAAGCNQGVREASGNYLIFLNNDTIVTPNWIENLIEYLKNKKVGLVGPVTNFMWNHQEIDINYRSIGSMLVKSDNYTKSNKERFFEVDNLAFFCIAAKKEVIKKVGDLDERFGIGMFEDDDYCLRVRKAGYKMVCTKDVFVHHFGQISLLSLGNNEYKKIYNENKEKFEKKWDIKIKNQISKIKNTD